MLDPPKKQETYIIPPDPAIVEGDIEPGAKIYDDPKLQGNELPQHARTVPIAQADNSNSASGSSTMKGNGEKPDSVPEIPHSTSAPSSVPLTISPTEERPSLPLSRISSEGVISRPS